MKADLYTINGGNTNLSIGVHLDGKLLNVLSWGHFQEKLLNGELPKDCTAIYSTTKTYDQITTENFPKLLETPKLNAGKFLGMPVNYTETIGQDRLFGSLYCYERSKNIESVFIDAGTFLTLDFLNNDGLLGGYIFPGLGLVQQNYSNGENLQPPELALENNQSKLPHSTPEAISFAYSHIFQSILRLAENRKIYLTGGNAKELLKLIPQAQFEPHLIHEALRHAAHKIYQ